MHYDKFSTQTILALKPSPDFELILKPLLKVAN